MGNALGNILGMFQFHKVRLKAFILKWEGGFVKFQFHKVRLKVQKFKNGEYTINKFQFHKVRLKEGMYVSNGNFNLFQFHKVRLKVPKEHQEVRSSQFQFHKVRLKVNSGNLSFTLIQRFNSIRYD